VIKSRRIGWAGHVACIGRREVNTRFEWGNLRERNHFEDSGIDGWIILRWIFRKWDVGAWTGSSCPWARVNVVIKLQGPQNAGNFLNNLEPVSFSRRNVLHGVSK
jgi:hypothetical protein